MEICGARPVSTCTVHDFVLVHVIACLLFFYLFRLATRNGSSHCIGPKKNRRLGLFVFVVSLLARLLSCLIACLFACLLSFYLFPLAARNGSSHCIGPKKKLGLLVFCFFVRSFACLFDRFFVCVSCSFFLCFFFNFFVF